MKLKGDIMKHHGKYK